MRHFLIEVYVQEESCRCICWGARDSAPPRFVNTTQAHIFSFRNGVVHVRVFDGTITRQKARAYVQAWFDGAFKTLEFNEGKTS